MIHVDPASVACSPAPAGADAPSSAPRALVERQLSMLSELAEIGMEIARAAGRQATAETPAGGDPALTYTRAARAVRLTIALQTQLLKDLPALERVHGRAEDERKRLRGLRLHGLVERALDEGCDTDHEYERLRGEARERLSEADDDAELDGRPFAEVVAAICKDLGLTPVWTARMVVAAGGFPQEPLSSDGAEGGDPRTQQARRQGPPSSSAEGLGPPGPAEWPARGQASVCAPDGAPPEDDGQGWGRRPYAARPPPS